MIYPVRLLTQQDYDITQLYLDKDPLYNIYLIHGLQTYGLNSKHAKFWGMFSGVQLEGVLYTDVLLPDDNNGPRFGCLTGDNPKVLAQLGEFSLKDTVVVLKGKSSYIQPVAQALSSRGKKFRIAHWHFYKAVSGQSPFCFDYPVRVATRDDIPMLVELYRDFELGSRDLGQVELEVQKAVDRSTCFFVELEGRAVSASMIVAETDRAGMISYSRTLPEFREQSLHLSVRTACYEYLFRQGKVGVGVFIESNIAMNKIISKYGSIIGRWSSVYFNRKPPFRRLVLLRLCRLGLSLKNKFLRQGNNM